MTPRFAAYAIGLCSASACTSLSDEDAIAEMNRRHPTGVGPWFIADEPTFATGQPHPCPCPDDSARRHVLFHC